MVEIPRTTTTGYEIDKQPSRCGGKKTGRKNRVKVKGPAKAREPRRRKNPKKGEEGKSIAEHHASPQKCPRQKKSARRGREEGLSKHNRR